MGGSVGNVPARVGRWLRLSSGAQQEIAALDGLRGLAILLVVVHHLGGYFTLWSASWPAPLAQFANSGWMGVHLFFVLSGFLLFLPYARAIVSGNSWPSIRQFYRRRALRILPVYVAFLGLGLLPLLLVTGWPPQMVRAFVPVVLLLQNMDTPAGHFVDLFNSSLWTLAIEWQFYLLLPAIAAGFAWLACRARRTWLSLAFGLAVLVGLGLATHVPATLAHYSLGYVQPQDAPGALGWAIRLLYGIKGRYIEEFALGMGVAVAYVAFLGPHAHRQRAGSVRTHLSAGLRRRIVVSGVLVACAGLLACHVWGWSAGRYDPLGNWRWPAQGIAGWLWTLGGEWTTALCWCVLLAAVLLSQSYQGTLAQVFAWPPLRALGIISYSVYIWHAWLIVLLRPMTWVVVPAILAVGAGSYYLIERPFLQLRYSKRSQVVAPESTPTLAASVSS
jgi:peptidoglycan/LPS O-acetylase OafA/YrhL